MGFKETMADMMMGKMTPEQKAEMMDGMMGKFFADMTSEDKQKMMGNMLEKFMGTMSDEEKKGMMQSMMPKMMGGQGGGNPMMNMMGMMMGNMGRGHEKKAGDPNSDSQPEMPWDMCKKMMSSIFQTSEKATFATPEVRQLFDEWAAQIEEEIWTYIQTHPDEDTEKIAVHFKLSADSVTYFLTRLANQGKINLKAGKK